MGSRGRPVPKAETTRTFVFQRAERGYCMDAVVFAGCGCGGLLAVRDSRMVSSLSLVEVRDSRMVSSMFWSDSQDMRTGMNL